jgi:hypothetical protein
VTVADLNTYPSIYVDRRKEITKILQQTYRPQGRYLKPRPPEYVAGILGRPRGSAELLQNLFVGSDCFWDRHRNMCRIILKEIRFEEDDWIFRLRIGYRGIKTLRNFRVSWK